MSPIPLFGHGLLGITLLLPIVGFTANEIPRPFRATFKVERNIIPLGHLTLNFTLSSDGAYRYTAHARPGMLADLFNRNEVIEESSGSFIEGRFIPEYYIYNDKEAPSESSQVRFDWSKERVISTSQGISWSQSIPEATQDKLSQQLQVRVHLARGLKQIDYQVADGGKLKTYHFQVDGDETIASVYGNFHCLRVIRSKASTHSDYTIWFAPELGYMPIKIERTQGGTLYRMVLEELSLPQ
jgi:hypothetical protein